MMSDELWNEEFWKREERTARISIYRARYLSWKLGREIARPGTRPGEHWWHKPYLWADTGEPVTS